MKSRTVNAIALPPEGAVEVVNWDRQDELNYLQTYVGGYIEAVTAGNVTFWINEEGKLRGLPINRRATALWYHLEPAARGMDVLVGRVIVTGGADDEGHTESVDPEVLNLLRV
jgi:hypothetical protein